MAKQGLVAEDSRQLAPPGEARPGKITQVRPVMTKLADEFRRLRIVFGDVAIYWSGLPTWGQATFGWILQTTRRPLCEQRAKVLPELGFVERTFAWPARYRRHRRDYE